MRVILVSSELLAGVFESSFYSRARSIRGRSILIQPLGYKNFQHQHFSANIITLSSKEKGTTVFTPNYYGCNDYVTILLYQKGNEPKEVLRLYKFPIGNLLYWTSKFQATL